MRIWKIRNWTDQHPEAVDWIISIGIGIIGLLLIIYIQGTTKTIIIPEYIAMDDFVLFSVGYALGILTVVVVYLIFKRYIVKEGEMVKKKVKAEEKDENVTTSKPEKDENVTTSKPAMRVLKRK